jgi:hypothetical protein
MPQVHNLSSKERTFGLMGELEQSLIPSFEHTSPGCRCLSAQPRRNELGLTVPQIRSSPHSVESIFERKTLIASLPDEFAHDFKVFGIPCFEPFGIVENKKLIFG